MGLVDYTMYSYTIRVICDTCTERQDLRRSTSKAQSRIQHTRSQTHKAHKTRGIIQTSTPIPWVTGGPPNAEPPHQHKNETLSSSKTRHKPSKLSCERRERKRVRRRRESREEKSEKSGVTKRWRWLLVHRMDDMSVSDDDDGG